MNNYPSTFTSCAVLIIFFAPFIVQSQAAWSGFSFYVSRNKEARIDCKFFGQHLPGIKHYRPKIDRETISLDGRTNKFTVNLLYIIVTNVFHLENSCNESTMVQCLQDLRNYKGNQSLVTMYHNKTAVGIICKEFYGALACIDGYIAKCSKGKDTSSYDSIAETVNKAVSKFCKSEVTPDQLKGNECMEKYRTLHEETCNSKTDEKMNSLHLYDDAKTRKSVGCRILKEFQVCTRNLISEKCGEKVSEYVEQNIMTPLSKLEAYKDCERILEQEAECTEDKIEECARFVQHQKGTLTSLEARNETAIKIICTDYNKTLSCVENYKVRCAKGADTSVLDAPMNMVSKVLNKFCNNEMTEDYIKMNQCIGNELKNLQESCRGPFQKNLQNLSYSSDEERNEVLCSSYTQLKDCVLEIITSKCGQDVANSIEELILEPMRSQITMIKDCKESPPVEVTTESNGETQTKMMKEDEESLPVEVTTESNGTQISTFSFTIQILIFMAYIIGLTHP